MPVFDVVSTFGEVVCSCNEENDAQGVASLMRRGGVSVRVNRRWVDLQGRERIRVLPAPAFRATSNSPKGGEFSDIWHVSDPHDLLEACVVCGHKPKRYRDDFSAQVGPLNRVCQPCLDAVVPADSLAV